jgi:proline iminopeptidase
MLPAHLQAERSIVRCENASSQSQPPFGLTGVVCASHTLTLPHGTLQYTIYRPRYLKLRPPLVCVAGGPLLPSTYLSPLLHLVVDRSIVLFDAVGCGQSMSTRVSGHRNQGTTTTKKTTTADAIKLSSSSSSYELVADMVLELSELLKALASSDYYLLGHSFGGVVAYEYLKSQQRYDGDNNNNNIKVSACRGVILASVPWSVPDCHRHCQELLNEIRTELGDSDIEHDDVAQAFRQRYECRVQPLPFPLQQAFQSAGYTFSSTRNIAAGLQAVHDYVVQLPDTLQQRPLPPALILRGQYDFITMEMCQTWSTAFASSSQCVTLADCSHYGMVEHEEMFGSAVTAFLQELDPPMKPLMFPKSHGKMG